MKVGDIVYLKNVGYPYDRTDSGHESWEGVSCTVTNTKAGSGGAYIEVAPFFPMRSGHGHPPMKSCLFYPSQVQKEDRPWLKKHLEDILALKKSLRRAALMAELMELEEA